MTKTRTEGTHSADLNHSKEPLDITYFPYSALAKITERFRNGAIKHGKAGYLEHLCDKKYLQTRANHAMQHLMNYLYELPNLDNETDLDNLAAVACNVAILIDLITRSKENETKDCESISSR